MGSFSCTSSGHVHTHLRVEQVAVPLTCDESDDREHVWSPETAALSGG